MARRQIDRICADVKSVDIYLSHWITQAAVCSRAGDIRRARRAMWSSQTCPHPPDELSMNVNSLDPLERSLTILAESGSRSIKPNRSIPDEVTG
jgi:hypothetical protein